jgi:hypothetical protein
LAQGNQKLAMTDIIKARHCRQPALSEDDMNRKHNQSKLTLLTKVSNQYSGAITPIALSALSAWLIVSGVKGLMGFIVTRETALADLVGILVVIAVARWFKFRSESK